MPAVEPARADIDVRQYSNIAALCLIANSFRGNGSVAHIKHSCYHALLGLLMVFKPTPT